MTYDSTTLCVYVTHVDDVNRTRKRLPNAYTKRFERVRMARLQQILANYRRPNTGRGVVATDVIERNPKTIR